MQSPKNREVSNDIDYTIDRVPLFEGMTSAEKAVLKEMMELLVIPKYHFIYKQGERPEYIYVLAEGTVKIGAFSDDGREILKQILHPQALFGELSLVTDTPYNNYALALEKNVAAYRIRVEQFKRLMRQSVNLNFNILSVIANRLSNTERRLESLVFKDARGRIVEFLRQNAEQHGTQIGYETLFKHNLTQQDIANFTGTSRQTVTSVLNDLRKENLIYFNRRRILIRDLASLA